MSDLDVQKVLEEIHAYVTRYFGRGMKANYIPALDQVDANQFAMTLIDLNKNIYSTGSDNINFSIQSVSKVFTLTMALNELGDEIWGRMEREPTGKAFDSLVHLEEYNGIPSNPFLNSGAIVIADILIEVYGKKVLSKYLNFMRMITGNPTLEFDENVFLSEKNTGHKNYAFAHYMKSYGNITNEVEEVLDTYFKFCSLSVNNADLARAFYFLSNKGKTLDGKEATSHRHTRRINAIMFTCGTYDEVGDFAYFVGLPVKSGVSGAIGGCLPNYYSVSVWSPELNRKGNSYLGFKALEELTTRLDRSDFG